MKVEVQKAFLEKEYAEAMRYMDNAKTVLAKSKIKDSHHYADKKYVRMACGTAYNAVLYALDAWFALKGVEAPKKKRRSIRYYESNLAVIDKKMLSFLESAYNILHLYGYYDGETSIDMIKTGFEQAYKIIEKIKPYSVAA